MSRRWQVTKANMRFVPTKTPEQQSVLMSTAQLYRLAKQWRAMPNNARARARHGVLLPDVAES